MVNYNSLETEEEFDRIAEPVKERIRGNLMYDFRRLDTVDVDGEDYVKLSDVEKMIYLDIDYSKKDIDWEQRMYEITMHAMPSCLESKYRTSHSTSEIVNDTLEIAKEFIKKLKEMEGKNE